MALVKLRWMSLLVPGVFWSGNCWAHAEKNPTTLPRPVSVTLWMDWTRGDPYYGADFIELRRRCRIATRKSCECVSDFKVISSKSNSKEFADYITSFEHGKVPVVYNVFYGDQHRFLGAQLVRVGDWASDKLHPNDRGLGIRITFNPRSSPGHVQSAGVHSPADCFPASER